MPIIKSAKKRVKQAQKAYERNKHYNSRMRTLVKSVIKSTDAKKVEKVLPDVYSAIDVALKKNIIHKNNAARKKSLVARTLAKLQSALPPSPAVKKTEKAAAPKVAKTTKTTEKAEAKKTVKKVETKK